DVVELAVNVVAAARARAVFRHNETMDFTFVGDRLWALYSSGRLAGGLFKCQTNGIRPGQSGGGPYDLLRVAYPPPSAYAKLVRAFPDGSASASAERKRTAVSVDPNGGVLIGFDDGSAEWISIDVDRSPNSRALTLAGAVTRVREWRPHKHRV